MERQISMSHDVIMSRLTRLEQGADDFSDSSAEQRNNALLDNIRAVREEVAMSRLTKNLAPHHDDKSMPTSQTTLQGTANPGQNSCLLTG